MCTWSTSVGVDVTERYCIAEAIPKPRHRTPQLILMRDLMQLFATGRQLHACKILFQRILGSRIHYHDRVPEFQNPTLLTLKYFTLFYLTLLYFKVPIPTGDPALFFSYLYLTLPYFTLLYLTLPYFTLPYDSNSNSKKHT